VKNKHLGSVMEKNGKIKNKVNDRTVKALKCYLAKCLLWNKNTYRKYKITVFNMYFKEILVQYMEQRYGQLETPLLMSTHKYGNSMKKKKEMILTHS
jgi:hypothetical protein